MQGSQKTQEIGACCGCGKVNESVNNILFMDFTAPVPGTGWGCVICGLPADGAVSVLCDDCLEAGVYPSKVFNGYVASKELIDTTAYEHRPFTHHWTHSEVAI